MAYISTELLFQSVVFAHSLWGCCSEIMCTKEEPRLQRPSRLPARFKCGTPSICNMLYITYFPCLWQTTQNQYALWLNIYQHRTDLMLAPVQPMATVIQATWLRMTRYCFRKRNLLADFLHRGSWQGCIRNHHKKRTEIGQGVQAAELLFQLLGESRFAGGSSQSQSQMF